MPDEADTPAAAEVVASYAALQRVESTLGAARQTPVPTSSSPGTSAATKAAGRGKGGNDLAEQLDLVARCIAVGAPTRVYAVSLGGFDTHADEKPAQTAQLTKLDQGLSALRSALAGSPRASDVVLVAYSEFGRRVRANASEGTDHGTAGPLLVVSDRVQGGYHGDQPSLTDLDNGDLKATTDLRAVYGELLSRVLGTDPVRVLDSAPPALGFLQ